MTPHQYGKWTKVYPDYMSDDHYWVKGWEIPEGADGYRYLHGTGQGFRVESSRKSNLIFVEAYLDSVNMGNSPVQNKGKL